MTHFYETQNLVVKFTGSHPELTESSPHAHTKERVQKNSQLLEP